MLNVLIGAATGDAIILAAVLGALLVNLLSREW